ncbi:sulfite exporter TauE/SafE family protein [Legionella clemsonensis]|uniref:Probable membrane transporter protein n=1 Tax=Legionella clemsonensis TaxID=1867846 RepID=A0A222P696_9GAMM|nr:sulfite exporter TauE/SafE family protein [Legionella clemsonensis]ASQ47368.1 Sulfite exporter TauE/SafE [Legionella clemsonensis]
MILSMALSGSIYALAGTFAGLISGVLGIGGGIIIVPCLLFIFYHNPAFPPNLVMHMAVGTSLAVMVFTTQSTLRAHIKVHGISWNIYKRLTPGIISGTIVGALLAKQLPTHGLKILLGLFLIAVGIKMCFERAITPLQRLPAWKSMSSVSFLIGLHSGLLGIGGGTLIVPYLNYCGVELRKIIPISAFCTLTVAMVGAIAFMIIGSQEVMLPTYSTGYIYWPAVICLATLSVLFAPLGAKMTYNIPVKQLKYAFVFVLFVSAGNLLV